MRRVLITGCTGFLGRHLADHLSGDSRNRLFGITDEAGTDISGMEVRRVDIRDREAVFQVIAEWKPEQVFHLAAVTNVGFSWNHQLLTYEVNFLGSLHIMEAMADYAPTGRVLVMSSAETAGLQMEETSEGPRLSIRSPYALSKAAMEMLGTLFNARDSLAVIPVRAFNFTGPGQDPQFVAPDFARQVALIEAGRSEPVIRVGNLSSRRDFSDVRDMARYVAAAGFNAEKGRLIRLGSGRVISIRMILDTLLSMSDVRIRVEMDPGKFRPLDIRELAGECPFLHKEMGMKPEYSLERTLADLLEEWRRRVAEASQS